MARHISFSEAFEILQNDGRTTAAELKTAARFAAPDPLPFVFPAPAPVLPLRNARRIVAG